ncbi:uncharacterized protein METZ01_LOCUS276087, partial [marine metagenome]
VSADYETQTSYAITITATDTGGLSTSQAFTVTVTDASEGPGNLALSSTSVAENSTMVGTATADGDGLTFAITGGVDADKFVINSATGEVSFSTAPDHESPTDGPTDTEGRIGELNNEYQVEITVTDNSGTSFSVTFDITVTDLNETVTGHLIDGYLAGATVFQDLNNNGVLDAGEPSTTSNALGAFTLSLESSSPDAPVRVTNTGFDTAANEVLTATLDISATTSGSYVLTPLSTLASRVLSLDAELNKWEAEDLVAATMAISISTVPNSSLFGYDPIALMVGSDATLATQAQKVYAHNQLLMTLGNITASAGAYMGPSALSTVEAAIQTMLTNAGKSATASLSWGDTKELRSEAHNALMDGLAAHLVQNQASVDAFLSTPAALADVLARTLVLQKAYLNTTLKALLTANTLTVDGTSKT